MALSARRPLPARAPASEAPPRPYLWHVAMSGVFPVDEARARRLAAAGERVSPNPFRGDPSAARVSGSPLDDGAAFGFGPGTLGVSDAG